MKRTQIDAAWKGTANCEDCGIRDLVLFADLAEPFSAPVEAAK